MEEVYKQIKGFEQYSISNFGNVKSFNNYKRLTPNKVLKPIQQSDGYLHFILSKDGKKYQMAAHRLVATAFVPNPQNKPFVNHVNGIKNLNIPENLEWVTSSENTKHAFKIGLMKSPKYYLGKKGKLHPNSKKLEVTTHNGIYVGVFYGTAEASRELNITQPCISRYCTGQRTHPKYKFNYIL